MSKEPKILGWVCFTVCAGIVNDLSLRLFREKGAVVAYALGIIQRQWLEDRFANPAHPYYDGSHKDEMDEEYERRREAVRYLQIVDMDEETDLVICEIIE